MEYKDKWTKRSITYLFPMRSRSEAFLIFVGSAYILNNLGTHGIFFFAKMLTPVIGWRGSSVIFSQHQIQKSKCFGIAKKEILHVKASGIELWTAGARQ